MKRRLFFTSNEKGFFLPYVLFIISIVFIVFTSAIQMYTNEVRMTDHHIDQLKIETLVQIGLANIKKELEKEGQLEGTRHYILPYGSIIITVDVIDQVDYLVHLDIETDQQAKYSLANKRIKIY